MFGRQVGVTTIQSQLGQINSRPFGQSQSQAPQPHQSIRPRPRPRIRLRLRQICCGSLLL